MAEDLAARRRIRRDLKAHEQELAPLQDPEHQARLTSHLETISDQDDPPTRRPRGRPRKGESAKYRQVVLYLLPETIAELDRLVDLQDTSDRALCHPGPMSPGSDSRAAATGTPTPADPLSLGHHDMAKLFEVDAANAARASRQTLYTCIKDRRINVDTDGLVGTAELLRAGCTLHTLHEIGRQDLEPVGHNMTSKVDTLDVYLDMITLLKQQRSDAQAREQAALQREQSASEREALLWPMYQAERTRYDLLLEAPRALPRRR